jgi:hypothetical protein
MVTSGTLNMNDLGLYYSSSTYESRCMINITNGAGIISAKNVDISQSIMTYSLSQVIIYLNGTGNFLNVRLRSANFSNSYIGGYPHGLYFNVCTVCDCRSNSSTTYSAHRLSSSFAVRHHFNNTEFENITRLGSISGAVFYFSGYSDDSTLIFEYCSFSNIQTNSKSYDGIIYASSKGILNITQTTLSFFFFFFFFN